MREVARAIAGSRGTKCVTGLTGRKVQRLRQAVRGVGVDRTLIRQLWICKHGWNEAEEEEACWKPSTSENQMSETGLWGGLGDLQYSLACDRGWRGVAPSVAVFQCSFFFFFFCSGDIC